MAKSKSFFGLRRGSTKSHTYQVLRGEQITKDRVYDVSNPQTEAQMKQRLKIPMVAATRSVLKDLVNHSFEGISYGDPSLKEFSSQNLQSGNLKIYEYVPKTAMDTGVADFVISRGSLPTPTFKFNAEGKKLRSIGLLSTTKDLTAIDPQDADDFKGITQEAGPLTEEFLTKICDFMGIEKNAQLTFLFQRRADEYDFTSGNQEDQIDDVIGHYHKFVIGRFINDITKMGAWTVKDQAVDPDNGLNATELTDGYITIDINFSNGETLGAFTVMLEGTLTEKVEAAAVIYSRQDNNVWKRSNSRMVVFKDAINATQDFDNCVYSYLNKSRTSKSSKYLNTGAEGVDITGGSLPTSLSKENVGGQPGTTDSLQVDKNE